MYNGIPQKSVVPVTSNLFAEPKNKYNTPPIFKPSDDDIKPSKKMSFNQDYVRPIFSLPNIGLGLVLCGGLSLVALKILSGSLLVISGLGVYGISTELEKNKVY